MFANSGRLGVARKETISLFYIAGYVLAWHIDLQISPYMWFTFSLHFSGYQREAVARNFHSHFPLIPIRVLVLKQSFQR